MLTSDTVRHMNPFGRMRRVRNSEAAYGLTSAGTRELLRGRLKATGRGWSGPGGLDSPVSRSCRRRRVQSGNCGIPLWSFALAHSDGHWMEEGRLKQCGKRQHGD